jgi:hypothetical protein
LFSLLVKYPFIRRNVTTGMCCITRFWSVEVWVFPSEHNSLLYGALLLRL